MLAGVQQTAPVTLTTKVDASALFAARQQYKSSGAEIAPSYNDIIVRLVAASLPECPELNACWINDAVYIYDEINIAIAMDTPRGLLAPVLRNVAALSLQEIAAESRRLAEQALSGNLAEEQMTRGTFTITNLGMFDIDYFTPIINLPQTAVLGIGRIADEPVVAGGKVVPGKTLSLSLTFDHRVIDGAPAAGWLQRLAKMIWQPDA
jgi:pyruvate dehydrogenase E2 component (dihydrolipoamide acetyltransferase)